jgi:hypothetical protein
MWVGTDFDNSLDLSDILLFVWDIWNHGKEATSKCDIPIDRNWAPSIDFLIVVR